MNETHNKHCLHYLLYSYRQDSTRLILTYFQHPKTLNEIKRK